MAKKEPKKVTETAVQTIQSEQEQATPMALIAQAIQNNIPVETMEKLMDLQDRWEAKQAKRSYDDAMAKFQAECPVIKKTKKVYEKGQENVAENLKKVRYSFAPIESIIEQTKDTIAKNGFSYTTQIENDEKSLTAIVLVKHSAGHSEQSRFTVPIGTESFMSDPQKYGARSTFAKRYAFLNAFGIMTGDEDIDARKETKPATASDKIETYRAKLEGCRHIEELKKVWADMPIEYKQEPSIKKLCAEINKNLSTA